MKRVLHGISVDSYRKKLLKTLTYALIDYGTVKYTFSGEWELGENNVCGVVKFKIFREKIKFDLCKRMGIR
jgi:hypothetical protein